MIKRIPIKGISRDPSGQVAADGFCAESLNVQLEMGEVAPVIKPQPVKDASGEEIHLDGDILFIHKGIGYENLIYRAGNALSFLVTVGDAQPGLVFDGLTDDEVINDIKAIGNTIILSTSRDMYYILWKEGAYHFLGNQIPIPTIHFRAGDMETERHNTSDNNYRYAEYGEECEPVSLESEDAPAFSTGEIGSVTRFGSKGKRYVLDSSIYGGFFTLFLDSIWGSIDALVKEAAESGEAIFPIFVRYAVRLYDGTLYAQSVPVLLGADINEFIHVWGEISQLVRTDGRIYKTNGYAGVTASTSFAPYMDISEQEYIFDGWEDIVTGVDVFISPQMVPLLRNAAKMEASLTRITNTSWSDIKAYEHRIDDVIIDPYHMVENQEELIRYYQSTFLAKSFSLDEFSAVTGEIRIDVDMSSDYIMAKEALKETPWSMHHTVGEHMFTYNKRLMLTDVEQKLYHGYPFLPSVKWGNPTYPTTPIRFVYHLRGDGGEAVVVCRDHLGNKEITPQQAAVVSGSQTMYEESLVSWVAYPDSRCYQVDIYFLSGDRVFYSSYKMKPMDQADVAYVFLGFGVPIASETNANPQITEQTTFELPNSLFVSKANNPFVFPAEDTITFTAGRILNLAVATKALSEGQFGQFPLYVFTDEGVFAMSVDSQGAFQKSHTVSRDVLVSREALTGIEQGVFFAAARGLLLLQGSEVTKVSELMDGPATALDGETAAIISNQHGVPVENPAPFYRFLSGCKLAYDYANTRIILFREDYESQFVYKFDTQSWHRMNTGIGTFVRALNSFPEAQVVTNQNNAQSVRNLSVVAESDDAEAVPGLIYTRDLILDNADVYKTVSRIKVRGRFLDGHVKWQLQGSNDGINYRNLHSLRGPSWKWYRIAIVSMLDPGERISYVELDYDPRFANKIR